MVEFGHVDICLEVSILSSHMAISRKDWLSEFFDIFDHLKKYHHTELGFESSDPVID